MQARCCFVLDYGLSKLKKGLERRGFKVYSAVLWFIPIISNPLKTARRKGCFLVTLDHRLRGAEGAIYIPPEWSRYNTWELVTKIVKEACTAASQRGEGS